MKQKKSWFISFILEFIWDAIYVFLAFLVICVLFSDIPSKINLSISETQYFVLSLIIAIVLRFLFRLYVIIVLRRLPKSQFCRLPQRVCKGTIVDKHTGYFVINNFHREWILFAGPDSKRIKIYSASHDCWSLVEGTLYYFEAKNPINLWESGTLYYRKGKKYNYFEHFTPGAYISED